MKGVWFEGSMVWDSGSKALWLGVEGFRFDAKGAFRASGFEGVGVP